MYHAGRAEITACHFDENYHRREIMSFSKALIMACLLVSATAIADDKGKSAGRLAMAFDAGSEMNDELCMHIPGPHCGGMPFSPGLAEGYVHISRGISDEGDLAASAYDWRNPVAHISVSRMD